MKLPEIVRFHSAAEYFTAFFALNQPELTFRSFGDALGWPHSLLGDIMHKRRGLAIARAIEFAQYFKMTGVDTERMVILALKDSDSEATQNYADTYLNLEGKKWVDPTPDVSPSPTGVHEVSAEFSSDLALSSLRSILIWSRGHITAREIGELLYLSPELKDPAVLNAKLQKLRELEIIEGDLPEVKILKPNIGIVGMDRKHFFNTLNAVEPLTEHPQTLTSWRTSKVVFPRALYPELNQRIFALVNWMHNSCSEPVDKAREEYVILQTNFMITHLLDLAKCGQEVVRDSEGRHRIERKPVSS